MPPKPIPHDESAVTDAEFLHALDLARRDLAAVRRALEADDLPAARQALVAHFRTRSRPHWFFDRRSSRGRIAPPWADATGSAVLARADAALENRFHLLGDLAWDFGKDLRWYTREMRGLGSAPSQFKRCNVMRDLALAWAKTRRPEYATKLAELIDRWRQDWPLVVDDDFGPTSAIMSRSDGHKAMPTAFRVLTWLDVLYSGVLFSRHVSVDTCFGLLKSTWFTSLQYRRYEKSPYSRANHHLWERGTAPFIFGTMLPEWPELARLVEQGRPVICRHTRESFLSDGTYEERSTSYTLAALRMFTVPQRLAQLNRVSLLDRSGRSQLKRCGEAIARLALPDGSLPDIGDGRAEAPGTAKQLATAAAVSGSRLSVEVARRLRLQSHADPADRSRLRTLPPSAPRGPSARRSPVSPKLPLTTHYPASGYFVHRDAWTPRASAMSLCVPGPDLMYNHAHDDALHLQLVVKGIPILGTPMSEMYSYLNQDRYFGTLRRGHFFAMTSHNLVLVRGQPRQSLESLAPRSAWGAEPIPTRTRWRRLPDGIHVNGEHTGYPGVSLSRQVTFRHGQSWEIIDRVQEETDVDQSDDGAAGHAPARGPRRRGSGQASARTPGRSRRHQTEAKPTPAADRRTHVCRWHFEYGVKVKEGSEGFVATREGVSLSFHFRSEGKLRTRLYRDEKWLGHNPRRPGEPAPWIIDGRFGGTGDDTLISLAEILT